MSNTKLFIPIILGTDREGRQSEKVANFILQKVQTHAEIETELFDVKNGSFGYEDLVIKSDGLIIVSPEYNHGYPGILKTTLDLLLEEYNHKSVGLVGVSSGPFGGTRVIEQLVSVVRELGLVVSSEDLHFSNVKSLFDDNANLLDKGYNDRTDKFLSEIVWITKALKYAREH